MPLQKQEIQINFTEGVDTKTDDKLAVKPEIVQNIRVDKTGTYKKRFGFESLKGSLDTMTDGELLATQANKLLMVSPSGAFSYSEEGSAVLGAVTEDKKWVSVTFGNGESANLFSFTQEGFKLSTQVQAINVVDNLILTGSVDSTTAFFRVIDKETGNVIGGTFQNSSQNTCFLVYLNSTWWGVSYSATKIIATPFDPAKKNFDALGRVETTFGTPAGGVANPLIVKAYNSIDVCLVGLYEAGGVVIYRLDENFALQTLNPSQTITFTGTLPNFDFDMDSSENILGVITSKTVIGPHNVYYKDFYYQPGGAVTTNTDTFSVTLPPTLQLRTSVYYSATKNQYYVLAANMNQYEQCTRFRTFSLGSFDSDVFIPQVEPMGNMVEIDGEIFCAINRYTKLSNGDVLAKRFICRVNYFLTPVAQFGEIQIDETNSNPVLSYKSFFNSPVFIAALDSTNNPEFVNTDIYQTENANSTEYAIISNDNTKMCSPIECNNISLIPGGVGYTYDGVNIVESGFFGSPPVNRFVKVAATGSFGAGTYQYALIYTYRDSLGNKYYSEPYVTNTITTVANDKVEIDTSLPGVSVKGLTTENISVFRRNTATETNYFLVDQATITLLSAPSYRITDSGAPTNANFPLYTSGGIIPNGSWPTMESFTLHVNRIFSIDSNDKQKVIYTKPIDPGFGPEFTNGEFEQTIISSRSVSTEPLVALASLDDKLICFKDDSVFAVFGDGPNAAGTGSFSDAKLVSTDAGCITPRSVVLYPGGLIFQSKKGIYQLSRSLEISYIGADVEDFNGEEITSSVLMSSINEIRFTTRNNVCLVYNYYYNQWSWFSNYTAQHAIDYRDSYCHLKSTGQVNRETSGFLDVATPIEMRVKNGWIKLDQLVGYQRIYKLLLIGNYKSSHTIKLKVYYDYEDYAWDTYTITPLSSGYNVTTKPNIDSIYTGTNDGVYQWQVGLNRQKCEAIKIELYDENITGESCSLTGLGLIIGLKSGLNKLASNKRF